MNNIEQDHGHHQTFNHKLNNLQNEVKIRDKCTGAV